MTKIVELPRGLRFDVFALPEDFDDQIRQAFKVYTYGTSKAYTYQDKLLFIDRMREYLHNATDAAECVKTLVLEAYEYNLDEYGELTDIDEFNTLEFMAEVFKRGKTNLYSHYTGDHHIDDKIMEMAVRVIRVVMNFGEERAGEWLADGIALKCSLCGKSLVVEQGDAEMNYCPHCGAMMAI